MALGKFGRCTEMVRSSEGSAVWRKPLAAAKVGFRRAAQCEESNLNGISQCSFRGARRSPPVRGLSPPPLFPPKGVAQAFLFVFFFVLRRAWKLELIERFNPTWRDLIEDSNEREKPGSPLSRGRAKGGQWQKSTRSTHWECPLHGDGAMPIDEPSDPWRGRPNVRSHSLATMGWKRAVQRIEPLRPPLRFYLIGYRLTEA